MLVDGSWVQQDYIKASNSGMNDEFGLHRARAMARRRPLAPIMRASNAVGIMGTEADDSLRNAGAVYVFTRTPMMDTRSLCQSVESRHRRLLRLVCCTVE